MKHLGRTGWPTTRTTCVGLTSEGRFVLSDARKWKLILLLVVVTLSTPMSSAAFGQEPNAQEAAIQPTDDEAPEALKPGRGRRHFVGVSRRLPR